jgi:hypothetical protein
VKHSNVVTLLRVNEPVITCEWHQHPLQLPGSQRVQLGSLLLQACLQSASSTPHAVYSKTGVAWLHMGAQQRVLDGRKRASAACLQSVALVLLLTPATGPARAGCISAARGVPFASAVAPLLLLA